MMLLLVCLLLGAGAAVVAIGVIQGRQPILDPADYLRDLDRDGEADEFEIRLNEPFLNRVVLPAGSRALSSLGRLTPVGQRDRIHHQLVLAGLDATTRAEELIALQLLTTAVGLLLGILYATLGGASRGVSLIFLILLPAIGYLGPSSWLSRRVAERKESIFLDLPDVLDLLAISVEAGVGFEAALDIVCQHFTSPLAIEFSRTLKEMELGLPRRDALQNLKRRTEVPELSNFVLALVQADALGMPIGRVLHTQASEMRIKRRQWAREKAGKLPVKILFPLVACIFPGVMIIVLGPAFASIGKSFH
jgi:tight adherence protein C